MRLWSKRTEPKFAQVPATGNSILGFFSQESTTLPSVVGGIRRVHWGTVGSRRWNEEPGCLFALWPEPVDHDTCFRAAGFEFFGDLDETWDADFEGVLRGLVVALASNGNVAVTGDPPVWHRSLLDRFLRRPVPELSLPEHLALVATDDQFAPCRVDFGSPTSAAVFVSDGHPIVWIWLSDAVASTWQNLLKAIVSGRNVVETTLNWALLLPSALRDSADAASF